MYVLLSIKPKYIDEIAKGNKKYEFRRVIFRDRMSEAWVYASSPTKKIVGRFLIGEIIEDKPANLLFSR